MNTIQIIDGIIQREGAVYTNRAGDRGGPTKFGIDQATLAKWRGGPVSAGAVEALTEAEARLIYTKRYVEPWAFISNPSLQVQCIDWGVTSGQDDPTRALQHLLGLKEDGVLGSATRAVANGVNPNLFACERAKFYGRIVHHDPSQSVNLNGWLNRALSFVQ